MPDPNPRHTIPALRVRQWLPEWEDIKWDAGARRSRPKECFYQFSIPAEDLRALSGIRKRTTDRIRGSQDLGIQRAHDESRSEEIRRFVQYGYPWSDLNQAKRDSDEFRDLKQPGWLPTAIVVNILEPGELRKGATIPDSDAVHLVENEDGTAIFQYPEGFNKSDWRCKSQPPIEIIDGQHRLWAFGDGSLGGHYELPVIAFVGLDRSWQAYLFYTINIKPKKINASLAFDLYPLLRAEEWLQKFEGHVIYRETRAQELVDLLWSFEKSPWHHRINMLGETGTKGVQVTQAAWVRSLVATLVKRWEGNRIQIGGLFGSVVNEHQTVLPWTRTDQAAFLIVVGDAIRISIERCTSTWTTALRNQNLDPQQLLPDISPKSQADLAFFGPNCLLNQDQGIRTVLAIINDFFFVCSDQLELETWGDLEDNSPRDEERISLAIDSLREREKIMIFISQLADALAAYDWRASSAPELSREEQMIKASFRGSGGYKSLRQDVLRHITNTGGEIATVAQDVMDRLGYSV